MDRINTEDGLYIWNLKEHIESITYHHTIMKRTLITISTCCLLTLSAAAQQFRIQGADDERTMEMKPQMTEFYAPVPAVVSAGDIRTGSAPSDAVVLFDGKDLSAWQNDDGKEAEWTVNGDGTMTVDKTKGSITTKEKFSDFQLHIEWCVPENIHGEGQGRGNSGVFLQGLYEVQILDAYENETYVNGTVASIYKQAAPLANPCRKPGEWNVYDIIYTAPTFKEDGTYRTNPYVTVIFNGVLVQNHTMILGTTEYIGLPKVAPHGDGPISLQCHGDASEPISFKNIWLRKL